MHPLARVVGLVQWALCCIRSYGDWSCTDHQVSSSPKWRACSILPVLDSSWAQVHPLMWYNSSWPKTEKFVSEQQLWFENLWFWPCKGKHQYTHDKKCYINRLHCNKMVSCTRGYSFMAIVHCSHWCLECRMHPCGADKEEAITASTKWIGTNDDDYTTGGYAQWRGYWSNWRCRQQTFHEIIDPKQR